MLGDDIFMCFMLVLVIIEKCGQLPKIGCGAVNEFFTMRVIVLEWIPIE